MCSLPLFAVPAAQYLRTSTKQQPYSIDRQKEVILEYANCNGFSIVHTYLDIGRSGLSLRERLGLSTLLHDIAYGTNNYRAILVYDVSRWGRFQDIDESAHYEFLCKALDVAIHYCAEPFENGSCSQSSILKSLKRVIAGEYSRELSAKCFRGCKHVAELGFRAGAAPGYGLRRMAVSADGSRSQLLKQGELKSLTSDHVVLVPGPSEEVQCVQTIFNLAAKGKHGFTAIAKELIRRGIPYRSGLTWQDCTIRHILTNEKYAGWNVWNRTSKKLSTPTTHNAYETWVRVPNAFPALVNRCTFDRVQKLLHPRHQFSNEELKARAEQLMHGQVIAPISDTLAERVPSIKTLQRRLRGLPFFRSRRGTACPRLILNYRQRMLIFRNNILDTLKAQFPQKITEFHFPGKSRPVLRLDNGLIVSVIVCGRQTRKTRIMRWMLRTLPMERIHPTLVGLDDKEPRYYFVPRIDTNHEYFMVGTNHALFKTGIQLESLSEFYRASTLFLTPNVPDSASVGQ
jgi:DNA invertase Pin-like site-specific DNA recombinase